MIKMEQVYYCNSCQDGSQYTTINNKINALTPDITNNPQITSAFYQTAYDLLKEVRDFGDKDTASTRLPNVDAYFGLEIKDLKGDLLSHRGYDDIVNCINNNSNSNVSGTKIYGSYWNNLRTTLTNIQIPSTRYWEKNCCCEGQCSSDGWYCPSYCDSDYVGPGPCSQGCYWGYVY